MTRSVSRNQLRVRAASSLSLVRISKGSWNRRDSSSCHCSARPSRADDQAALQVPARDQLLDQEPPHDGLAGAWVVGEEEAQLLARQHRLVDGRDLVRQRVDDRGVDRQQRVEQMRKPDALRLGHEPEQGAVAVEAPRPPLGDDLEPVLVVAVEQLVGDRAGRCLVRQLDRLRAEPLHADDRHRAVGVDAPDSAARSQVFELHRGNRNSCSCRVLRTTGQMLESAPPDRGPAGKPQPTEQPVDGGRGLAGARWGSPCADHPDNIGPEVGWVAGGLWPVLAAKRTSSVASRRTRPSSAASRSSGTAGSPSSTSLACWPPAITPAIVLQGYPWLEPDDIRACLTYARRLVGRERASEAVLEQDQIATTALTGHRNQGDLCH